jgi:hypothetical protein
VAPDPLQDAWQSQPQPALDADQIVREFRRGQQRFAATIFWRDVSEVGLSLVLIPVWVVMGVRLALPWTWYLAIPGLLWIAAFMTANRMRKRKRRAGTAEPLVRGVESSLAEVEHQIWLLRNVHWWYLLPLSIPILAFFGQVFWQVPGAAVWESAVATCFGAAIVAGIFAWIYRLNQAAVRTTLEPRRRELASMLRGLTDEPSSGDP